LWDQNLIFFLGSDLLKTLKVGLFFSPYTFLRALTLFLKMLR
jgi:hypothetical protein